MLINFNTNFSEKEMAQRSAHSSESFSLMTPLTKQSWQTVAATVAFKSLCEVSDFNFGERPKNKENKKEKKKITETSVTKIERTGMVNDKKMESRRETR